MNAVIITEGGNSIGLGHLTRCIALSQALEEKGVNPEFIVNGDDTVHGLLNSRNYRLFNWLEDRKRLSDCVKGAGIAIVDSYLADKGIYELISKAARTPFFIDDNKRLDYPVGIVVNGSAGAEQLDYPKKNGVSYLIGARYIPIRRPFWDVQEKGFNSDVSSIMVTTGGCDAMNITPGILKILADDFPKASKTIIVGVAAQNAAEIKKAADSNTRLTRGIDAEDMLAVMLESDVAISTGGQTLYELARVGVPSIGICVAENQHHNVMGMQEAGFIRGVRYSDSDSLAGEIVELLDALRPRKRREELSEIGRQLVDGRGARRVMEEGRSL